MSLMNMTNCNMKILIEEIPVVFPPLKGTAQRKMFVKRNIAFLRVTNTSGVFFMLPTNCLDTVVDGENLRGSHLLFLYYRKNAEDCFRNFCILRKKSSNPTDINGMEWR